MEFAWYGFKVDHPEDWAPALISGRREEGYARIASPESTSYQIRWKNLAKGADLRRAVDDYLNKLGREAKKLKQRFKCEVLPSDAGWRYRWSGAGNGQGTLFATDTRSFFLEASSTTSRSVSGASRLLIESFEESQSGHEMWSVLGLRLRLRSGLAVQRQLFQSGRTRIEWGDRKGTIIGERWGFGKQILEQHSFEDWAREALSMPKSKLETSEDGIQLEIGGVLKKTYGLARFDPEKNQLVILKVSGRGNVEKPDWDWLI